MKKPKILFFDCETSPNLAYVWGMYEQNVLAFKNEWQFLSVAWKWQGDSGIKCVTAKNHQDDKALCIKLHSLLQEADVIVAHNGDSFDLKKARARFIVHGLPPLKPVATVDTLKIARKYFSFNSNKLDDLGKTFKIGRKVKHSGFDLWLGCMRNDAKSWKKMVKYNKMDVVLLEKVYNKMLPWMDRHPNLAALKSSARKGCPNCGEFNIVKWGFRATPAGTQQRMMCKDCGAYHLTRKSK